LVACVDEFLQNIEQSASIALLIWIKTRMDGDLLPFYRRPNYQRAGRIAPGRYALKFARGNAHVAAQQDNRSITAGLWDSVLKNNVL
jgi:hypothetical protein